MTKLFCLNFWFYSFGSLGAVTSMLRLIRDSFANLLSWKIRGGLTTFAAGFPVLNHSNVCQGMFCIYQAWGHFVSRWCERCIFKFVQFAFVTSMSKLFYRRKHPRLTNAQHVKYL